MINYGYHKDYQALSTRTFSGNLDEEIFEFTLSSISDCAFIWSLIWLWVDSRCVIDLAKEEARRTTIQC